jgi:hypothetical protein
LVDGNPHRYLQFGIVAIKIFNFLPEFGPGKYIQISWKFEAKRFQAKKVMVQNVFVRILLGVTVLAIEIPTKKG